MQRLQTTQLLQSIQLLQTMQLLIDISLNILLTLVSGVFVHYCAGLRSLQRSGQQEHLLLCEAPQCQVPCAVIGI